MNRLLKIQKQIINTNIAIDEIENAILLSGDSFTFQTTIASLLKRRKKLQAELYEITGQENKWLSKSLKPS